MKFAIALYKALGIGMILGIMVICILVSGLVATVVADHEYGTQVSLVNATRWLAMIAVSCLAIPIAFCRIKSVIRSKIQ